MVGTRTQPAWPPSHLVRCVGAQDWHAYDGVYAARWITTRCKRTLRVAEIAPFHQINPRVVCTWCIKASQPERLDG